MRALRDVERDADGMRVLVSVSFRLDASGLLGRLLVRTAQQHRISSSADVARSHLGSGCRCVRRRLRFHRSLGARWTAAPSAASFTALSAAAAGCALVAADALCSASCDIRFGADRLGGFKRCCLGILPAGGSLGASGGGSKGNARQSSCTFSTLYAGACSPAGSSGVSKSSTSPTTASSCPNPHQDSPSSRATAARRARTYMCVCMCCGGRMGGGPHSDS